MAINTTIGQAQLALFGRTFILPIEISTATQNVFELTIGAAGEAEVGDTSFRFEGGGRDKGYLAWATAAKGYEATARTRDTESDTVVSDGPAGNGFGSAGEAVGSATADGPDTSSPAGVVDRTQGAVPEEAALAIGSDEPAKPPIPAESSSPGGDGTVAADGEDKQK